MSLNTSGIEKKTEKVRVVLRNQGSTLNNLSKIFPEIVKEILLKTLPFFCVVVSFSNDCALFLILYFLFKLSFGFTVNSLAALCLIWQLQWYPVYSSIHVGNRQKYGQQLAKCSNTVKHLAKSVAGLQL